MNHFLLDEVIKDVGRTGLHARLEPEEMKDPVRAKIDRYGLTRTIGPDQFFPTVREAIEAFRRNTGADWQPPPAASDN